jgi:5-methylcytosine-specific restriction enzyme B
MVALDLVILQKILPKYHGSVRELSEPLNDLGAWCCFGPEKYEAEKASKFDAAAPRNITEPAVLPKSFDKIQRMAKRLRSNHFVSFAE